eukprot:gene8330-8416_t
MDKVKLLSYIDDPHQKFYYTFNFDRPFDFHVELMKIILDETPGVTYPAVIKSVGEAPKQFGNSLNTPIAPAEGDDFDFLNEMAYSEEDAEDFTEIADTGEDVEEEKKLVDDEEEDEFGSEFQDDDSFEDDRPTASGKTAAAIRLAQYFNTVVISADSRQFYSEMSIGTAKPTPSELAAVKHFFIDSLSINETYSVGDYEKEAIELAICEGFDQFPDIQEGIREKLNVELAERGITELQERLKTVDQEYYGQVDLNNPQRVIRALELGLNLPREALYARINARAP